MDKYILYNEDDELTIVFDCESYELDSKVKKEIEDCSDLESCENFKLYKVTEQFSIVLTTKLNKI